MTLLRRLTVSGIAVAALILSASPGIAQSHLPAESPPVTTAAPAFKDSSPEPRQDQPMPDVKPVGPDKYSCPKNTYINCMPPVRKDMRIMCSPEYLKWVEGHCPGIKVVY
jgi:hypothetical protein